MTDEAKQRKEVPMYSGLLKYFPDALKEISKVSYIGNQQHHPDQPLHWDRAKSTDQLDALLRHLTDYSIGEGIDSDGQRHLAKVVWRGLAQLQLDIERDRDGK